MTVVSLEMSDEPILYPFDKFIHEGHEALSSFAKTDRVNFNEKKNRLPYTMALWHLL